MTRPRTKAKDSELTVSPRLRFPGFRNEPGWERKELNTIADPVSERAANEDKNNILTLSGEQGLVLQSEYFGKQVAGTNSQRYLRIERDDFVYNDRTTKASAYGTIKRLTKHPHGIVSPIYKCFRFKDGELPGFWEWYFEAGAHEAQLRGLANEGARAGRFNVSIDRLLSTSVCAPNSSSDEQQKIAECLSTLDELIGAEGQKLDALKAHKKGLIQQLFPREGETFPRLRFPEFQNAPEWQEGLMSEIAKALQGYGFPERHQGQKAGEYPFYKVSDISNSIGRGKVFIDESANYISEAVLRELKAKPIPVGTTIFAKIGEAIRLNRRAVTTRPCLIDNNAAGLKSIQGKATDMFVYFLMGTVSLIDYAGDGVVPAVNKSAIESIAVVYPQIEEQQKIAGCLSSVDDMVAAQSEKLEALETHKRGLMQQLFPSLAELDA